MLKKYIAIACSVTLIYGCATPPKFEWVKEGASSFERETAMSECTYQIKLNKTASSDLAELTKLCMQGKGYRYKQVS